MKLRTPCLDCGEPTRESRCDTCSTSSKRQGQRYRDRTRKRNRNRSTTGRGYNGAWKRLSKRAREQQQFCSDCGATEDLQADHLPIAWERYEKGLPLRLSDVDVVCGPCNRRRGEARPGSVRSQSKASSAHNGTGVGNNGSRASQGNTEGGERPLAGHRLAAPSASTLRVY